MISHMASHPEYFEEAIKLAVSNKPPYSWRAAWLLWSCMKDNDKRVQAYIKNIIDAIPMVRDGQQRELLTVLYKMELNEEDEGYIFNICVEVWEQIHKQPSVRMKALLLIFKIIQKYPDLCHEIELLTQEQYMETLSPGIKHSISKIMKSYYQ